MFQIIVGRFLIPGLVIAVVLFWIFWKDKKKKPEQVESKADECCKGSCHAKSGKSENKKKEESRNAKNQ